MLSTPFGTPARPASSPWRARSRASAWRLAHERAAGGQRGPALRVIIAAGKFHGVIAPRRRSAGAARRAACPAGGGDHVTVHALAFLGEPLEERCGVGDLALRLGERLALSRSSAREVVHVGEHQVVPAAQDRRALLAVFAAQPGTPGGGLDGTARLGRAEVRHRADHLAGGGLVTCVAPPASASIHAPST